MNSNITFVLDGVYCCPLSSLNLLKISYNFNHHSMPTSSLTLRCRQCLATVHGSFMGTPPPSLVDTTWDSEVDDYTLGRTRHLHMDPYTTSIDRYQSADHHYAIGR